MSKKYTAGGAEALFAAAFTYAFSGILVREISPMWGYKAQVPARFSIVLIALVLYKFLSKNKARVPKGKMLTALALGVATTGMVVFFTFSIQKTTVANTLFVFYAAGMLSSFIFGTVLLKERTSNDKFLAIFFVIAGLALYSGAIASGSLGIIFAIVSGVCSGGVNLTSKLLDGVDHNAVMIWQYGLVFLVSVMVTILSGDQIIRHASIHGLLLTVLFACFIMAGSYFVLYGFQNFDVNIGTVIMSTEIVFGAAMAYVLFGEVPKTHEFIGGALIFIGSIISSGIFGNRRLSIKQTAQPG